MFHGKWTELIMHHENTPVQPSSEDCFKIVDSASTSFQLKIKEAMHILWDQPTLNSRIIIYSLKPVAG